MAGLFFGKSIMASLMPHGRQSYRDNNGNNLSGGKLYAFAAGTSTPLDTYSDQAGTTPNTHPVVLNARGEATVFWGASAYKVVLKDASDVEIWSQDNLHASADLSDLASVASGKGDALVGVKLVATGSAARTQHDKNAEVVSVKDFGATGNGTTDDQAAVAAAVAHCYSTGDWLYWPDGTYLTTATIPNFHGVRHVGPGAVKRGADTWAITPDRTTLRKLYCSPSGNNANDGLTASQPRASIQSLVDVVHKWGPVVGRQQIIGAAGTYAEAVSIPDGLAQENNYLEFKFPSDPGVRGDPAAWPAGGAILDGTGLSGNGFETGRYNKIYIEYLLVQDWYDTAVAATSQVVRGINVSEFSLLYCYGVSALGNGFENIGVSPGGHAVVTGGILDGARYSCDATAGRISFTASAAGVDNTTIKNALEYGLHVKHNASAVLDYAEFLDCGQTAAAATYGAALFAYKSGASIDTRACTFKRNNIVYNARGGFIATHPGQPDVLGTGADVNDAVWKIKGFGADDLINDEAIAVRDISQLTQAQTGTVTGVTTALAYDANASILAGYMTSADKTVEIQIWAQNGAGGTAQIRPSLVTGGGTRYELGNFQIAASTNCCVRLLVYANSGGTIATILYDNNGATTGGTTAGQIILNPIPFDTEELEFQVWGDTTAANVLTIRKARMMLWG